ncbi:MAG: M28 family peptidase [Balneolaceae bacterium]
MKKVMVLPALALIAGCMGYTQNDESDQSRDLNLQLLEYSTHINESFLHNHLSILADDSMEGRDTGMPGQRKAAEYLAGFYEDLGFTPAGDEDYFQHYTLSAQKTDSLVYYTRRVDGGDTLTVDHSVAGYGTSSRYITQSGGAIPLEGSIVFAGFGINDPERGVTHLEGADLSGKWLLMFDEIPHIVDGDTLINPMLNHNERYARIFTETEANGLIVISSGSEEGFVEREKTDSVLLVRPSSVRLAYLGQAAGRPETYDQAYLEVSPELALEMLGIGSLEELEAERQRLIEEIREFEAYELPLMLDYRPYEGPAELEVENVIAKLEGGHPERRDEVVVLMAHYDHVGVGRPDASGDRIYNGADDNGSGTTALMAIAEALARAAEDGVRPDRTILFLHVSGEERGLLGSRYYSDHPVIPIENTVANFNADMIGRSDPENIEQGDTDYIYIIGGEIISSGLDRLVHRANDMSVGMRLSYRYNDLNDPNQFYRRSDHWNFGRLGVPFVFFFSGVHEDYHRPSDSIDKVDIPKLVRTTSLIYASTILVANSDERPEVDNRQFIEITQSQAR